MKDKKLIPLLDFVLMIGNLSTKEFCSDEYLRSVSQVVLERNSYMKDTYKFHIIAKYANFLNKPLSLDMFYPNIDGKLLPEDHPDFKLHQDKVIFKDCTVDTHTFSEATSICIDGILSVYWRDKASSGWRLSHGLKTINDLTKYGLTYIEK